MSGKLKIPGGKEGDGEGQLDHKTEYDQPWVVIKVGGSERRSREPVPKFSGHRPVECFEVNQSGKFEIPFPVLAKMEVGP